VQVCKRDLSPLPPRSEDTPHILACHQFFRRVRLGENLVSHELFGVGSGFGWANQGCVVGLIEDGSLKGFEWI
jgi:hypothetical protein